MKWLFTAGGVAMATAMFPVPSKDIAERDDVRSGREYAITNCSECHVVVPRLGPSMRVMGPPDFAEIANRPSMTRTALFAFLRSPHPTMPNLILSDRNADDVIVYILSLKEPAES